MEKLATSTVMVGQKDRRTSFSNCTSILIVDEEGVSKTSNGVDDFAIDHKDDKSCETLVKAFAERYAQNPHGVSGWAKILSCINTAEVASRGVFLTEHLNKEHSNKDEVDQLYQDSFLQKTGMMEDDPILHKGQKKVKSIVKDFKKSDSATKTMVVEEALQDPNIVSALSMEQLEALIALKQEQSK